jgi:hypothetical protein
MEIQGWSHFVETVLNCIAVSECMEHQSSETDIMVHVEGAMETGAVFRDYGDHPLDEVIA